MHADTAPPTTPTDLSAAAVVAFLVDELLHAPDPYWLMRDFDWALDWWGLEEPEHWVSTWWAENGHRIEETGFREHLRARTETLSGFRGWPETPGR